MNLNDPRPLPEPSWIGSDGLRDRSTCVDCGESDIDDDHTCSDEENE